MALDGRERQASARRKSWKRYGQCLELVPLDRRFHDISVGLYVKGDASAPSGPTASEKASRNASARYRTR